MPTLEIPLPSRISKPLNYQTSAPSAPLGPPPIRSTNLLPTDLPTCYKFWYQGKEVVPTCMIEMGLWRCAAARPHTGFDRRAETHRDTGTGTSGDWSLPRNGRCSKQPTDRDGVLRYPVPVAPETR